MTLQPKSSTRDGGPHRRFWRNRRGNIAIITAMMMIPLTFALGMAYDFTMAESRQDQIDGMADVATLGGVTPTMMGKSYATALGVSQNLFQSQIAAVNGVVNMTPDWTSGGGGDNASGASVTRTMAMSYTAGSQNVFAKLLGMDTFPLHGGSKATSSTAPNIDFYLLMDTSPSMEIAATSAGIATMIANTQQESDISPGNGTDYWKNNANWIAAPNGNGCAFGCHQSSPADLTTSAPHPCVSHVDPATPLSPPTTACQFLTTNYQKIQCTVAGAYADGTTFTTASTFPETGRDNYDLSRCLGITLRIDLLNTAAQNLMDVATSTAANDNAAYRMAIYETSNNLEANPLSLHQLQPLTNNLSTAKTSAASLVALEMCHNNFYACATNNQDQETDLDADLITMNNSASGVGYIPNPGTGTNNAGDTPQEVLFIVTDALNDHDRAKYEPMDWSGAACTAIKNRGIRIAVLYTTYTPLDESWYEQQVEAYLGTLGGFPNTAPPPTDLLAKAAKACASTGLYTEVSTDGDIAAALANLFKAAVSSARLVQ
jgi:Flp pilus assembly protein TadG